jgi:hypothetical protein
MIKFIRKYYDKYLISNKEENNIIFFWEPCDSFYNVFNDIYIKLYPNGHLHKLNDNDEYDKQFRLNKGDYILFIKNPVILNGPSYTICFNIGDTFERIKLKYTVKRKIMDSYKEVQGLYGGRRLYNDFVFNITHRDSGIGLLFNMRGD